MFDSCPKDPKKCHLWWEIPWENQETGEVQFKKGCILSQQMSLPIVQTIVRAAHVSSEHASQARNSSDGLRKSIDVLNTLAVQAMQDRQESLEE
jgi:hypothetical protein